MDDKFLDFDIGLVLRESRIYDLPLWNVGPAVLSHLQEPEFKCGVS